MPKTKPRLLLVDDDKMLLDALQDFLTLSGFEVVVACSATDVQEILASADEFAVAIVDFDLGADVHGGMIAEQLNVHSPGAAVVIVSGHTREHVTESYKDVDFFLQKPFFPKELVEQLRRLVGME